MIDKTSKKNKRNKANKKSKKRPSVSPRAAQGSTLPARLSALRVLEKVLAGQTLPSALTTTAVDPVDAALRKSLCTGVCRWYYLLQTQLSGLLKKPLKAKDQDLELALLLGLYQLHWLSIPDYAVIHTTTELARQLKKNWATGLINALLRKAQTLALSAPAYSGPADSPFPAWLTTALQAAWPQQFDAICQAHLTPPPLTLRVNRSLLSRAAYHQQLVAQGVKAQLSATAESALILEKSGEVTDLPGFAEGQFSVQDIAAQLAAPLLAVQPGHSVLDACAAPGGKSTHILERCPALHTLILLEKEASRAEKITNNLNRLRLAHLPQQLLIADATQPHPNLKPHSFDRILLDAPCSASGITRRHPDISLLRGAEDITALATQQLQLLENLWPLLKPEGILLYATCSILPQENQQLISQFLAQTPEASLLPLAADLPKALTAPSELQSVSQPLSVCNPLKADLQLLPSVNGPDGFYYARLRKTT